MLFSGPSLKKECLVSELANDWPTIPAPYVMEGWVPEQITFFTANVRFSLVNLFICLFSFFAIFFVFLNFALNQFWAFAFFVLKGNFFQGKFFFVEGKIKKERFVFF